MGEGLVWLCGFAVTRVQQLLLTLQPHTHTPSTSSYPSNGSRRIRSAVLMHFQYSGQTHISIGIWPYIEIIRVPTAIDVFLFRRLTALKELFGIVSLLLLKSNY